MYGIDKLKAKHGKWRIPESTLLGLAVIGGSIGAWLGMRTWHHKTMHKKFKYGIPLILMLQVVLVLMTSCKTKQSVEQSEAALEQQLVSGHSPNVFLVMYDANVGKEPLEKAIKKYKCEVVYEYNMLNCLALKKPKKKSLEDAIAYFKTVEGVVSVDYDNTIRLTDPVKPKSKVK